MTESQQFKIGDRVSWEFQGNTFNGTVQESTMGDKPFSAAGHQALGNVLVKPDIDHNAGWIAAEKLRHA